MSGLEPPEHGSSAPSGPGDAPGGGPGALRHFEAHHQRREAFTLAVIGGIGVVVCGVGSALLAGFVRADGLVNGAPFPAEQFPAEQFPAEQGTVRIVPLVMLVIFAAFGTVLAAVVTSGLVRALRRALILRIDSGGVTLERRWWWGRERTVSWSAVRGLSAYSAGRRDGDGMSTTTHWFQVDLMDGAIERRRLDRHRYSWVAMAEAVRTVAPRLPLTIDGELPPLGGS